MGEAASNIDHTLLTLKEQVAALRAEAGRRCAEGCGTVINARAIIARVREE